MADSRIKTIKIKTGVVKRLAKERVVYEKEAVRERARVEKFKSEGKDEYVIRKQEEVLQESLMMIPDTQRRLLAAVDDLKKILESEQELKEKEEYQAAQQVLTDIDNQLKADSADLN